MSPIEKVTRASLKRLVPTARGSSNRMVEVAQAFLVKQRLLPMEKFERSKVDAPTADAIAKYQRRFGLEVTGELDEPTIEVMAVPRCAMREGGASLALECRWGLTELRYAFENITNDVAQSVVINSISRAFETWSVHSGIAFKPVGVNEQHHISIAWRNAHDSDYDLVGADVAHADYPGACAEVNPGGATPIHFDGSECRWTDDAAWVRDDTLAIPMYDIETVALHEIGHVLGLRHSPTPGDVLYGAIPKKAKRLLSPNDIARIKYLYDLL
jgi:Matrixin/Putative peptidoglycan binding domain